MLCSCSADNATQSSLRCKTPAGQDTLAVISIFIQNYENIEYNANNRSIFLL